MKELKINKLTIAGAIVAAAVTAGAVGFAMIGQTTVASAQTTTEEEKGKAKSKEKAKGGASLEQICEAEQRTHARFKKWVEQGIPEEFGSEEPFTFDPSLCTTS